MELKNGYKVIYEVIENRDDGKVRTFKASKTGKFADATDIATVKIGEYKLIYEKDGKFYKSASGIPSAEDTYFEDFDQIFVEEAAAEDSSENNGTSSEDEKDSSEDDESDSEKETEDLEENLEKVNAYPEVITSNSDTHGEIIINGNNVTVKAAGEIPYLKSAWGTYGNWIGFRINTPEGIDATQAIYTRPNGKSSPLSEVLDAGKTYASVYSDMSKYGTTATYYLDWLGDGTKVLTVTIDVSDAVLVSETADSSAE